VPQTEGSAQTSAADRPAAPVYLTADLPALGGRIRERAEDFLVDEQPLYQPCGSGEHIYLFIEKRNLSTPQAAEILAQHFGVNRSAIGFAGMKDKTAITRQVFSIHTPGKGVQDFPMLEHERLNVLWADLHTNKLRRGHLAGNRFSIRIRGIPMSMALVAHKALTMLEKTGLPNRFGEQRFGYTNRNHLVGRAILLGDAAGVLDAILSPVEGRPDAQAEARRLYMERNYSAALDAFSRELRTERRLLGALSRGATPAKAVRTIERDEELFFLTAFQSEIFNRVLDERLTAGSLATLHAGDVAFKHDNRSIFSVSGEELTDPSVREDLEGRLASLRISPTGPMWGAHMKRAGATIDEAELAALSATGVSLDVLKAFDDRRPHRVTGERRPLRVPLSFPDVEGGVDEHGSYVRVAFDLPRGAFATSALRELMKPELSGAAMETPASPGEREGSDGDDN
jgi:tRNA pseudouridine13 synthase